MQKQKEKIRLYHIEAITMPFKGDAELIQRLFSTENGTIQENWFDHLNQEITVLFRELHDYELKSQLALLRATVEYCCNSAVVMELYGVKLHGKFNEVDILMAFKNNNDAEEFCSGYADFIENL